jgi:hypothetical protein
MGAARWLVCTCPPGRTTGDTWCDGPRYCDPSCQVCGRICGRTYTLPNGRLTERTAVCEVGCSVFVVKQSTARTCSDRCRQRLHLHPDRRCPDASCPHEAPWCVVHHRAWELLEADRAPNATLAERHSRRPAYCSSSKLPWVRTRRGRREDISQPVVCSNVSGWVHVTILDGSATWPAKVSSNRTVCPGGMSTYVEYTFHPRSMPGASATAS